MEFVGEWREGVYVGFCGVNFEEVRVGGDVFGTRSIVIATVIRDLSVYETG